MGLNNVEIVDARARIAQPRNARQLAQHRVDHAGGEAVTGVLGQLHALVNRGARRDAVHIQNLKRAQPQDDLNLRVELGVGPGEQRMKLMIEQNLPAQYAQHERRSQVAVRSRESVDCPAAQQLIGVRLPAFDGQ